MTLPGRPRNTFWAGILRDDEEMFSFYVRPVYLFFPSVVFVFTAGYIAASLSGAQHTGSVGGVVVVLCLFIAVFVYLMRSLRFDVALQSGTITHYIGTWRGWEQRAAFSLVGASATAVRSCSDKEKTVHELVVEFTSGDCRALCKSHQLRALTDAALIIQAKFNLPYDGTRKPTRYVRPLVKYLLEQDRFASVGGVHLGPPESEY